MNNESINLLKSAGKSIMSGIANELSESGITETLIKEGIPLNKILVASSKGKGQDKKNAGKNKASNKQKKKKGAEKKEVHEEKKEQPEQKKESASKSEYASKDKFSAGNMTPEQLREAVIWSEVLGKPACRKRRDKYANQRYACRR